MRNKILKKFIPKKKSILKKLGDTANSRKNFFLRKDNNLKMLLSNRYLWMNKFIKENENGIEFGAGNGLSKEFIKNKNYKISDISSENWLDYKNIDAQKTTFKNNSFDFIICSNMIHHLSRPILFIEEARRILKPNGRLIIQEINCSLLLKMLIIFTNTENYDFTVDVFNKKNNMNQQNDPWNGNNAIPNLLFDDRRKFALKIPFFKIEYLIYDECICFLNSGGVTLNTFYVPLPKFIISILQKFDKKISNFFPKIFALQTKIVLRKI